MMNSIPLQLIACAMATALFGILLNQPPRTIPYTSVIATVGYGLYLLFDRMPHAYFIAALFIGLSGELLARVIKKPATLFLTSAVIPLVPGIGLFRSMLFLSQGEYSSAIRVGTETVLGIFAIALAFTLSSVVFTLTRKN